MPVKKVRQPAMRQPAVAMNSVLAAMQRAWKSSAARLPKPRLQRRGRCEGLGKG